MVSKVYFLRHGERCDSIRNTSANKGEGFLKLAFDEQGNYCPHDINMPLSLFQRPDGWRAYGYDPPLTEVGAFSAKLTGRSFQNKGISIDYVYSSPALRCIETVKQFIEGAGLNNVKIRIEPGLYEWLEWFKTTIPTWIPPTELKTLGFPVDEAYNPIVQINELVPGETLDQFYKRSEIVMKMLKEPQSEEIVLIVAHVGNMTSCPRFLLNKNQLSQDEFLRNMSSYEYLYCEGVEDDGNGFRNLGRPIPPLTISAVPSTK